MDDPADDELALLGALTAVAVPRGAIDATAYLRRRPHEPDDDLADVVAAAAVSGDDARVLIARWAVATPGSPELAWFEAVRALGWEILLAGPDRGGDPLRRGWHRVGHRGDPKGASTR